MKNRVAVLVGASGLIGGHCLQALLAEPAYVEVIALVRKPILTTHRKLRVIVTDFTDLASILASISGHDVFCCAGTTIKKAGSQKAFREVDYTLVVTVAELMKNLGTEQFLVISSMGADKNSRLFYSRTKGEVEDALSQVGFDCLRIIRPSLLLGDRGEFRFAERLGALLTPLLKPFMVGGMKKYVPVEAGAVGRFMVKAALDEPTSGVHVYESDIIL